MTVFAITNNLDWTVSNRAVASMNFQGEWEVDPTTVAVHRDDTDARLGYVSRGYESVQNSTLLDMVNPLVGEGLLTVENMGYLNGGAKVFVQAKIAQEFRVVGESYNTFITLLNGHTGNAQVAIGPSTVRVICQNTFAMAYASLGEKFRHSAGVTERVLSSTAIQKYVSGAMDFYAKSAESLATARCTEAQFAQFAEQVFGKAESTRAKNVAEKLNNLFYNGAGNEGRTYYDAFNAVTEFSSHNKPSKAGNFYYANFGRGSSLNRRAMEVALDLVAA